MKTIHTLTGLAVIMAMSLATVAQGAAIIATSDGQTRDTNQDGNGDVGNNAIPLAGYKNPNNIQPVWAFSLASFTPASFTDATFSANVTGFSSNTTFNLDLHVVRIVAAATFATDNAGQGFLASDWETSDAKITDNFWTKADGTGAKTGDLTSYLQGASWSSTDLIILSLQQDVPNYLVRSDWTTFETYVEGVTDGATLTVVPEPSSFALLGGLLALGHVMVRRRR